jgi:signal transduction histidine kinase
VLDNARRHAPEHSHIHVSTARRPAAVELRVADQGPSVAPEARARVFEPYVQLGTAGSDDLAAPCLRLTLCKLAVEAHCGRTRVEDGQPGAGFCVSLPV